MADMSGATTESLDQTTGRPADLSALIASAIAELDLRQIAITRRLTPAQRCQEALSMIRLAEHARRSGRARIGCVSSDRN